jgi:tRNA A37 N6-isopentenylltransferase MiaA
MSSQAGPSGTQRPVVAVVGTTGVGKSNLAVSLCKSLARNPIGAPRRGKVLSADSMQLYKGLDVITNKVTVEEQGGVEHWGLDLVQPGQGGSWEVGKWCSEADREVSKPQSGADGRWRALLNPRSPSSAEAHTTSSSTTSSRPRS